MTDRAPAERRAGAPSARTTTDESRSFFIDLTTITVDPAYVEAAARAAYRGAAPRRRGPVLLLALALVGTVLGVAAGQTRERAPAVRRTRLALVDETERRNRIADALRERVAELREENAVARDRRLTTSAAGREIAERLRELELAAAEMAVKGPGIVVTLDNPRAGEGAGEATVRDRDIQQLVNALWGAGAEAIAVNGLRISPLTAIRAAGEAILVDYRALTPPYVVAAIGDRNRLEVEYGASGPGRRFRTWREVYGLTYRIERRDEITLAGATTSRLRHATPAPSAAPSRGSR